MAEKCELNAYKRQFITAALVVLLLAAGLHTNTQWPQTWLLGVDLHVLYCSSHMHLFISDQLLLKK